MNPLIYKIDRRVTALQAQGIANEFLSNSLPDRFTADQPKLADDQWRVPVILAYPHIGSLGTVGEIKIDMEIGTILSHTPPDQLTLSGLKPLRFLNSPYSDSQRRSQCAATDSFKA